jgi:hypothetical protein
MITEQKARQYRNAFNMCGGHDFALAWNDASKQHPVEDIDNYGGYAGDQFRMMQKNPLDFIVKWPSLAKRIVERYLNHE